MTKNQTTNYPDFLEESLKYGFIHNMNYKNSNYAPKILVNDMETGQHVLTDLQNEINKSISFCINVAFVTEAGIGMIKSQLSDFSDRGGKGKLLISPYLGFNHPNALKELLKLKNVEVRMTDEALNSHAKIYLFNHGIEQVAIIGSSNLTHNALKVNYEWNIKLNSTQDGDFIYRSQREFDKIWNQSSELTIELIESYQKNIFSSTTLNIQKIMESREDYSKEIKPNIMQQSALDGILSIRKAGKKRGLVISATGTGKTYLSAFDVKEFKPNKFIFIVHREQILRKACVDYQRVVGFRDEEACIYKSGMDISNKKYIFTTIQTLQKNGNLASFSKDYFDYILIDEVHKAGANTYQKVMNYFEPEFLLGMTATPERTDGKNIYEMFDYNIAYEIRLQAALNEEMLCPFLYYGVSDYGQDDELISEDIDFNRLIAQERIEHIIEKIEYYGCSGEVVRGLMFCSSKKEAWELSILLNQQGYKTKALTGENSQEYRTQVVKEIEEGKIDYILTVDIFNEGIDIPSINQVVMLRNTESSIIFIQQLGRGLRKHQSKEFVTIIDFIGNYRNNYLIPIALFGDQSMNKDNYRRELVNRNQLQGITTINFEEIAREKIFESINNTSLSSLKILKEKYEELENRLGRTPLLKDFIENNNVDPIVFFESNIKHYGQFLIKMKNSLYRFNNEIGDKILTFLSKELLDGKRAHELILLKELLNKDEVSMEEYKNILYSLDLSVEEEVIKSVINVLTFDFYKDADKKKYGNNIIEVDSNRIFLSNHVRKILNNKSIRMLVEDAIETGLIRSRKYDLTQYLTIGEKYSRKDACRLLLWNKDESSTMYGYKTKHGSTPIFVTYHKSDEISESTKYNDHFVNENTLHWVSKPSRYLYSGDIRKILNHKEMGIDNHLFIKKEDGEGRDFYYLGQIDVIEDSEVEFVKDVDGKTINYVELDFNLNNPISYLLYNYFEDNRKFDGSSVD